MVQCASYNMEGSTSSGDYICVHPTRIAYSGEEGMLQRRRLREKAKEEDCSATPQYMLISVTINSTSREAVQGSNYFLVRGVRTFFLF